MPLPKITLRTKRVGRWPAIILGVLLSLAAVMTLWVPQASTLHMPGPFNTGHTSLVCTDCHTAAEGTLRQQLQAKVRFYLGWRATDVTVGMDAINNLACTNCHSRSWDAHPIDRFSEPRFEKILPSLKVNQCFGCHDEHNGKRVTAQASACQFCHEDLNMRNDPLDLPHSQLVADKNWLSCMGCHDFHGNHLRSVQEKITEAIPIQSVKAYLDGRGPSPYGSQRRYTARGER
jgi:hypothetical protein